MPDMGAVSPKQLSNKKLQKSLFRDSGCSKKSIFSHQHHWPHHIPTNWLPRAVKGAGSLSRAWMRI